MDALLCENKKSLCILTPLSSESDPVEMKVDLVLASLWDRSGRPYLVKSHSGAEGEGGKPVVSIIPETKKTGTYRENCFSNIYFLLVIFVNIVNARTFII